MFSNLLEEIGSAILDQEEHSNVHIYTDGLKMDGQVDFAAALPSQPLPRGLPGAVSNIHSKCMQLKSMLRTVSRATTYFFTASYKCVSGPQIICT